MSAVFPLQQFKQVFKQSKKIRSGLKPFLAKFKQHNMIWIISSLEEIYRVLNGPNIEPLLKLNAILILKCIIEIAEVTIINFIEIYFLQILVNIASSECGEVVEIDQRGVNYFVKAGFANQAQTQQYGFNYVKVTDEIIQFTADLKPKILFQDQFIEQPSLFVLSLNNLRAIGWKNIIKWGFFKIQAQAEIKKTFQNNVKNYKNNSIIVSQYFRKYFKNWLQTGSNYKGHLNPYQMIQKGDSLITKQVLEQCKVSINSKALDQRLRTLEVLNNLIILGDIETAYYVNNLGLMDEIMMEIVEPNIQITSLARGKSLFTKYDKKQKNQQLYVYLLKCLQFWALCYPKGVKGTGEVSRIKFIQDQLRLKLHLEFPQDQYLKKNKKQFDQNSTLWKVRNKIILSRCLQNDPQNKSIINLKKQTKKLQKQATTPIQKQTDYVKLSKRLNDGKQALQNLCSNQSSFQYKINILKQLKSNFQQKLETAIFENDDQFQQLFTLFFEIDEKYTKISAQIDKYSKKQITFEALKNILFPASKSPTEEIKQQIKKEEKIKQNNIEAQEQKRETKQKKNEIVRETKIEEKKKEPKTQNIQPQNKREIKKQEPIDRSLPQKQQNIQPPQAAKSIQRITKDQKPQLPQKSNLQNNNLNLRSEPKTPIKKQIDKQQIKKQQESADENHNLIPWKSKQNQNIKSHILDKGQHSPTLSDNFANTGQKNASKIYKHIDPQPLLIINQQQSAKQLFKQQSDKNNNGQQKIEPFENKRKRKRKNQQPDRSKQIKQQTQKIKNKSSQQEKELQIFNEHKLPNQQLFHFIKQRPTIQKNINIQQKKQKNKKISQQISQQIDSNHNFDKNQQLQQLIQFDDGLIYIPQDDPKLNSFYLEQQLTLNEEQSFNNFLKKDNQQIKIDRAFALLLKRNNSSSNILKSSRREIRSIKRAESARNKIPLLIQQNSIKMKEQLQQTQQMKNLKIKQLEMKKRKLESESKLLSSRVAEQQRELITIKSSRALSINNKTLTLAQDQDHDRYIKSKLLLSNSSSRARIMSQSPKRLELNPFGKLISCNKFKQFFIAYRQLKQKKNILRHKILLFKSLQIQIGCMDRREGSVLQIHYYITPKFNIDEIVYNILQKQDNGLVVDLEPAKLAFIQKEDQVKIVATVQISSIPYNLPEFQLAYNIGFQTYQHKFIIQCPIHKFFSTEPITEEDVSAAFSDETKVFRGQEVPFSSKLLKDYNCLSEFLPSGIFLRNGNPNQQGCIEYVSHVNFNSQFFYLKVTIRPNKFLFVSCAARNKPKVVQFCIAQLTHLLSKNIELKQM